ncbi:MAG TPA: amino acid permease [Gemmatimonadales bacterium]|jgi:APA family basic amino acid/polyamine antiporter|nr:amino acid permease [Gemmatimonadales bacterium]
MPELKRSLRVYDGLAMVVGIMVGSGIFRTPGLVAQQLGRPWLTFVAWVLGGGLAFLGALVFAELATRLPRAGGKYVYAREAFGPRAGFVVGVVEAVGMYPAAIAAISVASAEFLGRLAAWPAAATPWAGLGFVALFTAINLIGVASGRWVQNLVTTAKVLALGGVVVIGFAAGSGVGWSGTLPSAPAGLAVFGALAVAFQSVIWTYYGWVDAAKIAEEVVEPNRTLPRVFFGGIAIAAGLYLLLNAAFLNVLPLDKMAASNLVPADVAAAIFGSRGGVVMAVLALVVVLASLNGNVFVTPRVLFGLARDGLAPAPLARVNAGGTPWVAMLVVAAVAGGLAATGEFTKLLALAVAMLLLIDSFTVLSLFRLRARTPDAPFRVPLYPVTPWLFIGINGALLVGAAAQQWRVVVAAVLVLVIAWGLSFVPWRD